MLLKLKVGVMSDDGKSKAEYMAVNYPRYMIGSRVDLYSRLDLAYMAERFPEVMCEHYPEYMDGLRVEEDG